MVHVYKQHTVKVLSPHKNIVDEIVKNLELHGMEYYFPIPDILKLHNTESIPHSFAIESIIKDENIKIYESEELKKKVIETIEKQLRENVDVSKEIQDIYICLKKTGYYSWYEFILKNWGAQENFLELKKIDDNTFQFVTLWSSPLLFFKNLAKKLNLQFEITILEKNTNKTETIFIDPYSE